MQQASVAASVAATLARVEEHDGDAVAAMRAGGVALGAEAVDMADLVVRLTHQVGSARDYGELVAQTLAAGFEAGRHFERTVREGAGEPHPPSRADMAARPWRD
jgi:hypothetical protein